VGSWGKDPVGDLETKPPEVEAKCEISLQFLTFACIKFMT